MGFIAYGALIISHICATIIQIINASEIKGDFAIVIAKTSALHWCLAAA